MTNLQLLSTPWQQHVEQWRDCDRCSLCSTRQNVVLARGKIPCDVLFVGEAPGPSEDAIGQPFIGPAGSLLDQIIRNAVVVPLRIAFTNLVACIPLDSDGKKFSEPDDDSILACKPRLEQFIEIAQSKIVVAVGKLAQDFADRGYRHSFKLPPSVKNIIDIKHPAAILRMNVAQQGLEIQRCIVTLRMAVEEHLEGGV